jgi:hypothetical protein
VLDPSLAAGVLDQNPPHCFRRRGEEMPSVVPLWSLLDADQPQIGLMHQGGRLQSLAGVLAGHTDRRQFAEFLIHQRQQLLCGSGISLFDASKNLGDIGHAA